MVGKKLWIELTYEILRQRWTPQAILITNTINISCSTVSIVHDGGLGNYLPTSRSDWSSGAEHSYDDCAEKALVDRMMEVARIIVIL